MDNLDSKLEQLETLFVKYGASPTELNQENIGINRERTVYSLGGCFFRAGSARFDGKTFLLISSIDKVKYAELGIMEDIDILPLESGSERLEKAVRYALGVEPYPEKYPEDV